ncbi:MAG: class I SAM-dependent methyltransferase [Bacilli bacterium]
MEQTIETHFGYYDSVIALLKKETGCSALEAIADTNRRLLGDTPIFSLDEVGEARVRKQLAELKWDERSSEEQREILKISLIKAMRQGVQSNHQMTPDTIGFLIGYCANAFFQDEQQLTLVDPTAGVGHLLFTVKEATDESRFTRIVATEVDDTLVDILYSSAELRGVETEIFHGDVLRNSTLPAADCVICDLPIGYYPDQTIASSFSLYRKEEEMSYAHELIMEQSIAHTRPGGYLFFVVPSVLFQGDTYAALRAYVHETCVTEGFIELPSTMFRSEKEQKSIWMLRRKGEGVPAPKQPLFVQFPPLKNEAGIRQVMSQMREWFSEREN